MSAQKKHITVLVSNDLQHDQRVAKVCETLMNLNYDISLVGRMMHGSSQFERPYETHRFKLLFYTGALFYAALNIRLFFYLLFKKTDVILSNDLDTLLPAFLVSRLRCKKLVYDSHEYFTEAEGLTGRKFQKRVWEVIEGWIFPRLEHVYTVNDSIANIYAKKYGVNVSVVRNIPLLNPLLKLKSRIELGLPEDKKILLLQGAYIDPDRGGKELVEAMPMLPDMILLIIGSGREIETIKNLVRDLHLEERVRIYPKMPFEELRQYTANVDLGLSLDKPLHLNYTLSLPNKLFDYIHAGVPVLVSDLPELRRVVNEYHVGWIAPKVEPEVLANEIARALASKEYDQMKRNCLTAREKLNWQQESQILRRIYTSL